MAEAMAASGLAQQQAAAENRILGGIVRNAVSCHQDALCLVTACTTKSVILRCPGALHAGLEG